MKHEHLTERQVAAYHARDIESGERRALDRHLAACEACLRRVVDTKHMEVAVASLTEAFLPPADAEPFHLSRAELKRYAEGSLDGADRIIFESHLEDCPECSGGARELLSAGTNVTPLPRRARAGYAPQAVWESFTRALRRPSGLRPVHVGAIALAVVCALAGLLWIQSRLSGGRDRPPSTQSAAAGGQAQSQSAPTPQTDHPATRPADDTAARTEGGANPEGVGAQNTPPPSRQDRRPQDAPEVVVSLNDGGREVRLDEGGNLTGLEGTPLPVQRAVKAALSGKELERPDALAELAAQRITLLGQSPDDTPFALRGPVGRVVVTDRPTFRWQPLAGATDYTVAVFDANFNGVSASEPQSATQWQPTQPLPRGGIYFWQVTARKDGRAFTSPVAPAPRAQFKILEGEKLREIAQVKGSRPDSHLVLGLLYARAGLLDEAERELRLLAKANPRSEVAGRLLRRVRSWKRP